MPEQLSLEVLTWSDVRAATEKVNSSFAQLVDEIDPNSDFPVLKIRYPFGAKIMHDGILQIPTKQGKYIPFDDVSIPASLKKLLHYDSHTPLILQLHNQAEVFLDFHREYEDRRTVPLNLFKEGDMYGLFESVSGFLNEFGASIWNITSGARTVFMLPKINDKKGCKALEDSLGIKLPGTNSLYDHWSAFCKIYQATEDPWYCEILIFTTPWLTSLASDPNWLKLQNFLFQQAWAQSRHMRQAVELSYFWDLFASKVRNRHFKPNTYLVDTIKNLLYISTGSRPGLQPANADNSVALPVQTIENAYADLYGMQDYYPTIMLPGFFNKNNKGRYVYYSLNYPTLTEGTPSIRQAKNIIVELREIKELMKMLLQTIEQYRWPLYNRIEVAHLDYFHSDNDETSGISNDTAQLLADKNLITMNCQEKRTLSLKSPFLRGCIRIGWSGESEPKDST